LKRLTIHIIILLISSSIFISGTKAFGQKTDTIVHINGDVLTGELKKMIYGVITWKMDGMGTINLEEVKVNTMKSKKMFEIKMNNGFVYFGSFDTSGMARTVNIVFTNGKQRVRIDDIVEIYPIKRNFWARSSGDFSLGANYNKGSKVGTISFSGNLSYRKKKTLFKLTWDDNNTFQGDTLSASKSDASFAWQRLIKGKWSFETSIGASQNTELGTKLRVNLNPIGIYDVIYNNWNRLFLGGGLSVSRETHYTDADVTNDLAGLVGIGWKVYRYRKPKVWVDADVSYIPYLTDWGRNRVVINLNPKVGVFNNDFKIGVKYYYNFDSRPSGVSSSKSDYGITLELTYSFH